MEGFTLDLGDNPLPTEGRGVSTLLKNGLETKHWHNPAYMYESSESLPVHVIVCCRALSCPPAVSRNVSTFAGLW